jgi:hypothetical protein
MPVSTKFSPGFRLSELDIGVLILALLGTILVGRMDSSLALALAFPVAHFFLFCNVLRMARPLELIWAALYLLLAGCTVFLGLPTWKYTFGSLLLVTVTLAVVQLRKPSYHGICWQRINPRLEQWWAHNAKARK